MATFDDFMRLDIRVGTITEAKTFCRFPLYLYYNTILMCRQGT